MAQQTAVEWLIEQLEVFVTLDEELTWDKLFEQAKQMEKEQLKQQTSLDNLKDKAERSWTPCHGCDENDKNFWINGYITGALEN